MIFTGIALNDTSALIIVESGTIDADSYVDNLVDQCGIIPEMNQRYGPHGWTSVQDGRRSHGVIDDGLPEDDGERDRGLASLITGLEPN
jgi:hypothetical protein